MTVEPENLVLELLRTLRGELQTLRTEMRADFNDLKHRMTTIERGIGGMKRDTGDLYDDHARQQVTIDRLSERIERIERRLDLHDG